MCHFSKPTQWLDQERVTAFRFSITVALMMYKKEMWRNDGGTATKSPFSPNFFCHFSPNETFWNQLKLTRYFFDFFVKKNSVVLHITLSNYISKILSTTQSKNIGSVKCKYKGIFLKENKLASTDSKIPKFGG